MRRATDRLSRGSYHNRADDEWPPLALGRNTGAEEVFQRPRTADYTRPSNAYDLDARSSRPGYSQHAVNSEIQRQVWRGNNHRNSGSWCEQTPRRQNYNYSHNRGSWVEEQRTRKNFNHNNNRSRRDVSQREVHPHYRQAPQQTNLQQRVEPKADGSLQNTQDTENMSWNQQQVSGRDYQMLLYKQAVLSREQDDDGWPHIIGSCLDMCPAEERNKRARLRDLAVFERLDGDQSKTSKELAVKKFCRTFSGKDLKQSDVRPLLVLRYTMEHLVKLLDLGRYPFEVVHDFLFDRTRAIRQELSMQRITDELAVSIYENIVRFHIMSERELREERASGKVFDSHLNSQQLSKALLSLLNLYLVLSSDKGLRNEAEFYCYYVLLNMNQPQQLALWFQSVNSTVLRSDDVQFARNVLKCYEQNNYVGFFRLVTRATYLQACLMELYFNEVRTAAIKMINQGSYKLHPYPLCELASTLLMEPDDLEEFCSLHGLAVGVSASNEVQLLAKQAEFTSPKQPVRHFHCQVIENKRPARFQDLCTKVFT